MIQEHPDPERRWRNRRRMAWACVVSGLIVYPALVAWFGSGQLASVAIPFYGFLTLVVGVYIGSAAYETVHTQQPGGAA